MSRRLASDERYSVNSRGRRNTSGKRRSCDGGKQAPTVGSSFASADGFTRSSPVGAPGASAEVLGRSCSRAVERGVGGGSRRVSRCWGRAGFANVVACHLSVFVLCRGATYRSSSEKRLRFFKPAVVAYVRSPGSCAAHRRRSRENCGGTQQREVETSSIEPRPPNGMPIGERSVRKLPNSLRNGELRQYVQDRLGGLIAAPDGAAVPGPNVRWVGRRRGRRQDRRWAASWSPEQIANRLRVDFPDDESMRISHEAIYQALYVQGRGALRRELTACLRTGRALRVPRARARGRGKTFVRPEIMISERPAEADDRAVPGHWEGDLILGLSSSAIGTLVERTSRFTMLPPPPSPPQTRRAQDQERASVGLGTAPKPSGTRSPRRSRPCPSNSAGL